MNMNQKNCGPPQHTSFRFPACGHRQQCGFTGKPSQDTWKLGCRRTLPASGAKPTDQYTMMDHTTASSSEYGRRSSVTDSTNAHTWRDGKVRECTLDPKYARPRHTTLQQSTGRALSCAPGKRGCPSACKRQAAAGPAPTGPSLTAAVGQPYAAISLTNGHWSPSRFNDTSSRASRTSNTLARTVRVCSLNAVNSMWICRQAVQTCQLPFFKRPARPETFGVIKARLAEEERSQVVVAVTEQSRSSVSPQLMHGSSQRKALTAQSALDVIRVQARADEQRGQDEGQDDCLAGPEDVQEAAPQQPSQQHYVA